VSASGLMFSSQFLRHILAITNYIFMRWWWWWCPFCTRQKRCIELLYC
jgi:hypothetical protein